MLGNTGTYDMAKFLGSRYRIPNYQREYVWEETHLSAFWDDLEDTISDKSSNHFFGQIVIHHDEDQNFKYIIDGQQRTITSIFFLRRVPKRGQNSEQNEKSLKKRKMPLQAFEFPEYVIPSCCSFPL